MSIRRTQKRQLISSNIRPISAWALAALLLVLIVPTQAFGLDSALVRSLLIPGLGQAHQGHYTKASILAGSAVLSGFGLFLSQVYYNEAVTKYRDQQRIYASYGVALEDGNVVSIQDMNLTYTEMEAQYNSAEDRLVWRNAFLAAFIATYAVNVIDVLISKPHKIDSAEQLSVDVDADGFRVTKTFRF